MDGRSGGSGWPSAVVACTLIVLVGAVTIAAIVKYDIDSALKMWAALGSIVGVLTGAFVTYFFSRGSVEAERRIAAAHQERATKADAEAAASQARAADYLTALAVAERHLDSNIRKEMSDDEKLLLQRVLTRTE